MWITKRLQAKSSEAIANKYVIHCMNITMIIISGIWFLNIIDIFLVSKRVMAVSVGLSLVVYAVGMICWIFTGIEKKCVKYFMILWTVMVTTIMGTGLTYHALLASVIPILFCSLYTSKKLHLYTLILTIISTVIVVFVGYHFGICDANMTLLTGEPLSVYLDDNGMFTRIDVNDRIIWSLSLFFVLPRSLIYVVCMVVCYNISKIIRNNVEHAKHMEILAEIDGMTGLYNKSKYLSIFSNVYENVDRIAVIFWDINSLKKVNDTYGHEAGDLLIRTFAESVRILTNDDRKAFRIGGDEFVMIISNAEETDAVKIIDEWNTYMGKRKQNFPYEMSASVGYACGKGHSLQKVIKAADAMMYENKKKYHELKGDRRDS